MTGIGRLRTLAGEWDAYGLGGTLGDVARQIERERACDADTIENVRLIVGHVIDGMERHCLGHEGMEDSPVARWARELRDALKSDTSEVGDTQTPSCADADEAADVTSEAPKVTRDPAEDVSMSAYDLLPEDERDAIAWVREHGGLDYVRTEWRSRVPRDRYKRRRQRLLGHIAECETALGRRNVRIEELGRRVGDLTRENAELRRRAMPEGIEWLIEAWPRFEDNAPVKLGDMALIDGDVDMVEAVQIWIHGKPVIYGDNGSQQLEKGERVRLPVLAADGEPLEAGQTVWDTNGDELVIGAFEDGGHTVTCRYADVGDAIPVHGMWSPSDLTHQRPVLDADGVEIRAGDTVWHVETGEQCKVVEVDSRSVSVDFRVDGDGTKHTGSILPANLTHRASVLAADGEPLEAGQTVWDVDGYGPLVVTAVPSKGEQLVVLDDGGTNFYRYPEKLTHKRPDSWERIEEDAMLSPHSYICACGKHDDAMPKSVQMSIDLVRRARALAERERGE